MNQMLNGVWLLKKKITIKLAFGALQFILALSTILVALLLKFNLFNLQSMLGDSLDCVNFYVVFLLAFGFVFVVSGFFLIYDWWEA